MSRIISFSSIADFFKENIKQLERGENAYNSGHVKSMTYDGAVSPALLKGRVQASMKDKIYQVEVSLILEDGILNCQCTCPRGQAICHHAAALCVYAHHNLSATDVACSWSEPGPSRSAETEVCTIEELYPVPEKMRQFTGAKREVTPEELNRFQTKLGTSNLVGFTWLLRPSPDEGAPLVPVIEDILFSEEFIKLDSTAKAPYLAEKLAVSQEMIEFVAKATTGQASCEQWLITRKNRLTASNFGLVLAACKRGRYPPSLFKRLTDGYNLESAIAIQWGKSNEKMAIAEFVQTVDGAEVKETGLWLDKCGFLGASPDGLCGTGSIIEVKCPYKYRNASMSEALKNDKTYVIHKQNGNTIINKDHIYYHQIQGQLHIMNMDLCYLVIWTPNESEIVIIERDEEWAQNIQILKTFYMENFIPYMAGLN